MAIQILRQHLCKPCSMQMIIKAKRRVGEAEVDFRGGIDGYFCGVVKGLAPQDGGEWLPPQMTTPLSRMTMNSSNVDAVGL